MTTDSPGGWAPRLVAIFGAVVLAFATIFLSIQAGPVGGALPGLGLLVVFLLFKMPLRWPALTLMFVILVVETPVDRGPWKSPVAFLGELLTVQLNLTIPAGLLVLTGAGTILLGLTGIYWWRRATNNTIDRVGATPAPREIFYVVWLAIAGVV